MAKTKQNEVATRRLFIRITDAEKANIRDQAKRAGLTMSEYMRRISLNKRIVSKMDQKALGELARLGGLQKHLLKQIKGKRLRRTVLTHIGEACDCGRSCPHICKWTRPV
jgi:hypothetical protein